MFVFNMKFTTIIFIFICLNKCDCHADCKEELDDKPLILTKFIKNGELNDGKNAAKVEPFFEDITSYSGFFTVNEKYNSNMFFWFFPAENKTDECQPLLVWLQGGLGISSLFGLYYEHGPFHLNENNTLSRREYYWTQNLNVLYIDSPIGIGFSFTENISGYSKNDSEIANNLYIFLKQFLTLFSEYKCSKVYLSGEAFAGKYIPSLAYTIDNNNNDVDDDCDSFNINLEGMIIGNGWFDPISMLNYSTFLYYIALLDENGRAIFMETEEKIINLIKMEEHGKALDLLSELILGPIGLSQDFKTTFEELTDFNYLYNYLQYQDDYKHYKLVKYIENNVQLKSIIHVGNLNFNKYYQMTEEFLKEDYTKSVKNTLEILLNKNYRIVFYTGQLDVLSPYASEIDFIYSLNWSGADEYKIAERQKWYIGEDLAGYSKTSKNFTEIFVRIAGHFVPADQPKFAFDLLDRIINDRPIISPPVED